MDDKMKAARANDENNSADEAFVISCIEKLATGKKKSTSTPTTITATAGSANYNAEVLKSILEQAKNFRNID